MARASWTLLLLGLMIAASGCASKAADAPADPTPDVEAPVEKLVVDYECTASPGGVVGGVGGENGVTISGCRFTVLKVASLYLKGEIPTGCDMSYFNDDGDNLSDGTPEVGQTYDPGTSFNMGCGPENATATGKITLQDA